VFAGMQRVEIGPTIEAQRHGLGIDHKLLGSAS
jgi:hypothetical protein